MNQKIVKKISDMHILNLELIYESYNPLKDKLAKDFAYFKEY